MDRHQIIDQDRPRRARAYGGDPFQISFARLAHLDPARLLALLGREVGEVVVLDLVTEYAAQQRDRPAGAAAATPQLTRSEEHTSELQSRSDIVCRLLLEKKNQ